MSTCALLTSIPTHVPSVLTREPPARRVSRILTQPCECGLSVLAGPSNGSGSAGQRWDDLAGERSCQTVGSAICPTLLRASGSFAGRGFKIQGLLALDRYRPSTWVTDWTEDMGDTYRADLRRVRALEGNVTHGATPRVRAGLEQARDQHG